MKNVFKAIVDVFNNEYVKALYITIFVFNLMLGFILVIINFPVIWGICIVVFIFLSIYLLILENFM